MMNFEHTSFKELQTLYTKTIGHFPLRLSRKKIIEELEPYFAKKRGGKREGAGRKTNASKNEPVKQKVSLRFWGFLHNPSKRCI